MNTMPQVCTELPYSKEVEPVVLLGFPGGSVVNPPASAGAIRDSVLISGSGRFTGESNGNPLQYSCLGNPMDRAVWWATVHGVAK